MFFLFGQSVASGKVNTQRPHRFLVIVRQPLLVFGKRGIERLQGWLRNGGTLVAIGRASGFLRDKDVDISKLKPWEAPKKKDDDKSPPAEERYNEFRVPGAAFRTKINDRSFFTFGAATSIRNSPLMRMDSTAPRSNTGSIPADSRRRLRRAPLSMPGGRRSRGRGPARRSPR